MRGFLLRKVLSFSTPGIYLNCKKGQKASRCYQPRLKSVVWHHGWKSTTEGIPSSSWKQTKVKTNISFDLAPTDYHLQSAGDLLFHSWGWGTYSSSTLLQRLLWVNSFPFLSAAPYFCGGSVSDSSGVLQSPNYPGSYPNDADCVWEIQVQNNFRITLTFRDIA